MYSQLKSHEIDNSMFFLGKDDQVLVIQLTKLFFLPAL